MRKISALQRRATWILFLMVAGSLVLTGRIAWLQLVQGAQLTAKAQSQLTERKALQSPRGTIFDRNRRELAVSSLTKSLYADPQELNKDPDTVANLLAPIVNLKAADIKDRLTTDSHFIWIKRTLEKEQSDKIAELIKEQQLHGFGFVEESKRYYPNDLLAAQVLGFVGTDDAGLDGIEMVLDKEIKGELHQQVVETDSYGVPIYKSIFKFAQAKEARNVLLTLDSTIQFIVEQCLDRAIVQTQAKAVTAIIMNPKTGEILAMASRPGFNPNQFYRYNPEQWKNRAVSILYEPGSTFKSVVAASALQEKVVRADERFFDSGFVEVSGRRIQNWDGSGYGSVTLTDVIKNSINTIFAQIGLKLGGNRLNDYARAFGFGKLTGIELPGEEEGLLFENGSMRDSDVATMAIGQSIAVTPLQLITAVSAIANDGVLLKPHIIKEIQNPDGSPYRVAQPEPVRQVITAETAKTLIGLLEKVVSEGGGRKGAIEGYHFAGKTGTAEKLKVGGGGYAEGRYIASFVGFGPVENVQVAALVVIDDPQGIYYGGEIAAPVFKDIMTQVMRYLNIAPQADANAAIPVVKPSQPAASPQTAPLAAPGKAVVPALAGKNIRECADALARAGLSMVPVGSGIAVKQSITPYTPQENGTEITVWFEPRH